MNTAWLRVMYLLVNACFILFILVYFVGIFYEIDIIVVCEPKIGNNKWIKQNQAYCRIFSISDIYA
jgi:uncharacterized membrane protein